MKEITNRHAILVMAHNQFEILEKIIKVLDHERIDFYVHIDKKVKDYNINKLYKIPKKSQLYLTDRINVIWGDYSQIECELMLLKKSSSNQNYQYYHLISGTDLPLKNIEYILNFFDKNKGTEFVHFCQYGECDKRILQRVDKYYFHFKKGNHLTSKIHHLLDYIQKKLNISRTSNSDLIYSYGANWFSITDELTNFVIKNEKMIRKNFRYSLCADELFLQTLVYNSSFYEKTYFKKYNIPESDYHSICRCIDWNRGEPYVWKTDDFDELITSDYLFARKFDINEDSKIIDLILSHVCNKQRDEKSE